ncbi:MAG: aminopeptidase P family protein [Alphaproteobacteria bacterium]|nr:aminopeptidase P family protein [Alphaproteobacteria bacterium]
MFQNFDVTASADKGKERTDALRARFDDLGIDGFFVPRADRYQGEYVPASDARLAWMTGFTGSAGIALILRTTAHVFVDGRYTTQVREQVDTQVFSPEDLIATPPSKWLKEHGGKGWRLGVDPWLHTISAIRELEKAADEIGASIIRLEANPVDAIWTDRPADPTGAVAIQPSRYAGPIPAEKVKRIKESIRESGAQAAILADPSSVAWTFNIRGNDVPHTPHPLCTAILSCDGRDTVFIDSRKLDRETTAYLTQLADLREPAQLTDALAALGEAKTAILVDPALTAARIGDVITAHGGELIEKADPARLPRAEKNAVEQEGSRSAHRRDGAAMVTFLAWLDAQKPGTVDEIEAVKELENARRHTGERLQMPLKDISFETISGAGPHGAIIHYRVNTDTNRTLQPGELYLVDSGGQYVDGTTDITRTVAIGAAGESERRFFTLVLKGMITISMQRFPEGTRGVDIDPLARFALWNAGADYAHGTGHGVGAYLSVHEGPQSISRRGMQELKPGMIVSNEPGYYRESAFGIRIENLVLVQEPENVQGGDKPMLGFETLTLCPIDRRLIDATLLTDRERDWLNGYHTRVRSELTPLLDDEATLTWLVAATEPISPKVHATE